jgi:RNA polymerase sigma factor (sigma-70 family)
LCATRSILLATDDYSKQIRRALMSRYPRNSLEHIVDQCRQGDDSAWHELIDLVGPVIFAICRRSKLSRDESFDIYGQVCLELVRSIEALREPEKLPYVVATITRRQIYGYYQKMRVIEYLDDETLQAVAGESGDDPEQIYTQAQRRQMLLDAISELKDKDRKLLSALFLDTDEPSYKEIAAALKMPVSSIGPLRAKALRKLCGILKKRKFKF